MHKKFHRVTWSDFESLEKKVEELELQRKLELKDELTKELASKVDSLKVEMQAMEQRLKAEIELVRKELSGEIDKVKTELDGKIDKVRAELSAKIENEMLKLDRKFTIMFLILLFTFILFNKDALEFLLKVLGLIK